MNEIDARKMKLECTDCNYTTFTTYGTKPTGWVISVHGFYCPQCSGNEQEVQNEQNR